MQLTLQLDATSRRPVVKLDWFNGCRALLDTGALFPVWTSDGKLLQQLGAKLEKKEVTFGGFGGKAKGSLYRVDFRLGELVFKDMPIVATDMKDLNCHLILSATMFDKMIYEIDAVNHKLNIDTRDNQPVRLLKISDDNGKISVYLAGTYENVEEYTQTVIDNTQIDIIDTNGKSLSDEDLIKELF